MLKDEKEISLSLACNGDRTWAAGMRGAHATTEPVLPFPYCHNILLTAGPTQTVFSSICYHQMAAALAGEFCSIYTGFQLVCLVFEVCFTNSVTDEKEKREVSFYSLPIFGQSL